MDIGNARDESGALKPRARSEPGRPADRAGPPGVPDTPVIRNRRPDAPGRRAIPPLSRSRGGFPRSRSRRAMWVAAARGTLGDGPSRGRVPWQESSMSTADDASVTHWIGDLKAGDPAAARKIWERYYETL